MEKVARFMCSREAFPQVREGFIAQRYELTEALSDVVQLHLLDHGEDILSTVQMYLNQMMEDIKVKLHPIWENFTHLENRMREMQATLANRELLDLRRHKELTEFNTMMKGWTGASQTVMKDTKMLARHIEATTREMCSAWYDGKKMEYKPMTDEEGCVVEEYIPSGELQESVPKYVPSVPKKKKMTAECEQEQKDEPVTNILEKVNGEQKKKVPTKGEQKEIRPAECEQEKEKKKSSRAKQKEDRTMDVVIKSVEDEMCEKPGDTLMKMVEETTKALL